jgi:hypothetical protein
MRWLAAWPRPPPVRWPRLPDGSSWGLAVWEGQTIRFTPNLSIVERRTLKQNRKARRLSRVIVTGVATAAALFGSTLLTATPAEAATPLGGVDMQRACRTQYPSGWGLTAHVSDWKNSAFGSTGYANDPDNAYTWRCWAPWDHRTYSIDVNRACVNQYGRGAYAGLGNSTDPYSWYCRR